jgi:hypothetical protein
MNNKKDNNMRVFVMLGLIGLITLVAITGCIDKGKVIDINKSVNMTPVPHTTSGKEVVVTPIPQGTNGAGISSSTSGIIERYNLDKLIYMSDSIVIAEVINLLPSRWSTPSGNKPTTNNGMLYTIYTDADIKIVEYLKGSSGNIADNATITVRMLGGTVGQDKQYVEDQPSYSVHEKVLVFLKNDSDRRTVDIGGKHFVTVGMMQGKISIPADNKIIIGDVKMSLEEARVVIAGKGNRSYDNI